MPLRAKDFKSSTYAIPPLRLPASNLTKAWHLCDHGACCHTSAHRTLHLTQSNAEVAEVRRGDMTHNQISAGGILVRRASIENGLITDLIIEQRVIVEITEPSVGTADQFRRAGTR